MRYCNIAIFLCVALNLWYLSLFIPFALNIRYVGKVVLKVTNKNNN